MVRPRTHGRTGSAGPVYWPRIALDGMHIALCTRDHVYFSLLTRHSCIRQDLDSAMYGSHTSTSMCHPIMAPSCVRSWPKKYAALVGNPWTTEYMPITNVPFVDFNPSTIQHKEYCVRKKGNRICNVFSTQKYNFY